MSYEGNPSIPQPIETLDGTGCPNWTDLVPGQFYIVENLLQTSVGAFSFYTHALTTTELAADGTVYSSSQPVDSRGWEATIDWASCQLLSLEDHVGNKVSGTSNISNFPWYQAVRVSNNIIEQGAVLTLGGQGFLGTLTGNRVSSNASLIVAAAAQGFASLTVRDNRISGGSSLTVNKLPPAALNILRNILESQALVTLGSGANAAPAGNINNNRLVSGTFNLDNIVTLAFNNNVIFGTNVNLQPVTNFGTFERNLANAQSTISVGGSISGSVNISDNILNSGTVSSTNAKASFSLFSCLIDRQGAIVADTANVGGDLTISNCHLAQSLLLSLTGATLTIANMRHEGAVATITVNSGGIHNITDVRTEGGGQLSWIVTAAVNTSVLRTIIENAGVLTKNAGGASIVSDGYINNGTLDVDTFNAQIFRLQDANSTLVGNVTNAQKVGYANALP